MREVVLKNIKELEMRVKNETFLVSLSVKVKPFFFFSRFIYQQKGNNPFFSPDALSPTFFRDFHLFRLEGLPRLSPRGWAPVTPLPELRRVQD